MKRYKVMAAAFCLIFIASVMTPAVKAQGQNGDKKTTVTFTEAIEIPGGVILPAGTYFFKLLNADTGRYIVQISNEHETHMFATLITIPNFRYHPTDQVVMTFAERQAGAPPAIRTWFFPGEKFGREFVYPKARALELAQLTNETVLAMPVDLAANITAPAATAEDAPVVALTQAPIVAVTPAGTEVPLAAVVEGPAQEEAPAVVDTTPLPLPHTASSVPLVGLIGLLAICAAFSLVAFAKRTS
jgi:hypothetical protein